jgi:hypothetical protein
MKKPFLIVSVVAALGMFQAAYAQSEQPALPPGFALAKPPAFSKWQIIFSYDDDKSAAGGGDASAAAAGTGKVPGAGVPSQSRQLTVTRTAAYWQAVLVTATGETRECWGDGETAYFKPSSEASMLVLVKHRDSDRFNVDSYSALISNYNQLDFPDLDWISPQTYLGVQKGMLIFQQGENGAMAWVAADTRYPISWKKGKETRIFQFLSPPTDVLTLPVEVAKISLELKRGHQIDNSAPPQRVLPPP